MQTRAEQSRPDRTLQTCLPTCLARFRLGYVHCHVVRDLSARACISISKPNARNGTCVRLQGRAGGSWRWRQRQQRQRRRTERGATARGRQRGPPRRGRARRGRGCCCCRSNTGRRQRSAVAVRSSLSSRLKQSQFNWLLAPVALRHSVHVNVGGMRHGAVGLAQCGRRRTCTTYEYCCDEGDKARENGDDAGDGGGQMACLPWQCKQTCIVHLPACAANLARARAWPGRKHSLCLF